MRRLLPALLLLLTALIPSATVFAMPSPGPIGPYRYGPYGCNLRWNNCFGDNGAINRAFACDTNTGTEVLVGSWVPAWDLTGMSGAEVVIDLASAGTSLPAWWSFRNAGTCRQAALAMNFIPLPSNVVCMDWAAGQSAGGIGAYQIGGRGANTARIVAAIAVPSSALANLIGRKEYFAFNLNINHSKTVGTGACAGCTTPVCIVFNRMKMTTQVAAHDTYVQGPSNLTDSDYATWQGGAGVSSFGGTGCPAATPTKRETWGAVKSLYR